MIFVVVERFYQAIVVHMFFMDESLCLCKIGHRESENKRIIG